MSYNVSVPVSQELPVLVVVLFLLKFNFLRGFCGSSDFESSFEHVLVAFNLILMSYLMTILGIFIHLWGRIEVLEVL